MRKKSLLFKRLAAQLKEYPALIDVPAALLNKIYHFVLDEAGSGDPSPEMTIDPDDYVDGFNEMYMEGIKNLKPLTVILEKEKTPPNGATSMYDDMANHLIIFTAGAGSEDFNLRVQRDVHHELIHWVQFKLLKPKGYDVNKGITPEPGQNDQEAYEDDYTQAERELPATVSDAYYDSLMQGMSYQDFEEFVGIRETENTHHELKQMKKDAFDNWKRAVDALRTLMQ